jgi:H+/Cl- antiporter ClcA
MENVGIALRRFNQRFNEKQKLRFYLLLVILFFIIGIILTFTVAIISTPYDLSLVNKTQVVENLSVSYANNQIPVLNNSFLQIFTRNLLSGVIVLLLPGFLLILSIFAITRLAFFLDPRIDPKKHNNKSQNEFKIHSFADFSTLCF